MHKHDNDNKNNCLFEEIRKYLNKKRFKDRFRQTADNINNNKAKFPFSSISFASRCFFKF